MRRSITTWNKQKTKIQNREGRDGAGIGLWLFLKSGIPDYLFFRVPFAFLDYEKPAGLVLLENLLMLLFWAFLGTVAAYLCRNAAQKPEQKTE